MAFGGESLLIPLYQMGAPKASASSNSSAVECILIFSKNIYIILRSSWQLFQPELFLKAVTSKDINWKPETRRYTLLQYMYIYIKSLGPLEVLLLQWTEMPSMTFDCVELFAGVGNVSAAFRQGGKSVASFDKTYADKSMDINGAAGFMPESQLYIVAIPVS